MFSFRQMLHRGTSVQPVRPFLAGPIGIELSQREIRLMQIRQSPQGDLSISAQATAEYPEDWNGYLGPPKAMKRLLRSALKLDSFCGRRAVVALPPEEVKIMPLAYPRSDKGDGQSIMELLDKRIQGDLNDFVIDYLPVRSKPEDQERLALVAMTDRKRVEELLDTLAYAGLEVMALDIGPAAINRVFASVSGVSANDTILVINSGREKSYLTIISGRRLLLDQQVDFGEATILNHLTSVLDVNEDVARGLLLETGFENQPGPATDFPLLEPGEISGTLREILKPLFLKLAEEINQVLIFSASETRGNPVARIYLLGAMAYWRGTEKLLDGILNIPVMTVSEGLSLSSQRESSKAPPESVGIRPQMVVATGLALRGMTNDD